MHQTRQPVDSPLATGQDTWVTQLALTALDWHGPFGLHPNAHAILRRERDARTPVRARLVNADELAQRMMVHMMTGRPTVAAGPVVMLPRAYLLMSLLLLAQFVLGMAYNLFVTIPAHHPGAHPSNYLTGSAQSIGWAIPHKRGVAGRPRGPRVGTPVIVGAVDGSLYAARNHWPHLGFSLTKGPGGRRFANGDVTCPWHNSRFDLCTGENRDWTPGFAGKDMPRWSRRLIALGKKPAPWTTYPVTVEGENVFVEVPAPNAT